MSKGFKFFLICTISAVFVFLDLRMVLLFLNGELNSLSFVLFSSMLFSSGNEISPDQIPPWVPVLTILLGLMSFDLTTKSLKALKKNAAQTSFIYLLILGMITLSIYLNIGRIQKADYQEKRRVNDCALYWWNCNNELITADKLKYGELYIGPTSQSQNN